MNRMCKLTAALLAGVLLGTALTSCKGEAVVTTAPITTSVETTTAAPKDEAPKREILSPGELFEQLLSTSDFTVENRWSRTENGYTNRWSYLLYKDGDLIRTEYSEPEKKTVVNYGDLANGRYYEIAHGDWIFLPIENTFYADGVAAFLRDISPIDGKRDWEDKNYGAYDATGKCFRMKASVLKAVFAENGWDSPPDRYSMTFSSMKNGYVCVYSWSVGEVSMSQRVEIRFEENSVTLPTAENDPIAETPYTGEALDAMLEGMYRINIADQLSDFFTIGFEAWENEESAEHLFDGIKTYDEWYYNEDGSLKDGAFPEIGEGGGPGKCGGQIGNFAQFVFQFPTQPQIAAYVLTNGNDNEQFNHRTPVRWALYGSYDALAEDPETAYETKWVLLDYVWDGGMENENFFSGGYLIDPENIGQYPTYCLQIEAASGNQFQLGEIEFYVKD